MNVIILILLLILFIPHIAYILFLPIAALWIYKKPSVYKESKQPSLEINENNRKSSFVRKFIVKLRNTTEGFLRWHILKTGYIPSHHFRNLIYRHIYFVDIQKQSIVYYGAELRGTRLLHIGEGCVIGDKAVLDARRGGIFIGKYVRINSNVSLWTGSHNMNDPYFRSTPEKRGPIVVGDRVWIGPNVTILHSVTIGEGAVIAAGAVVTKDVEPYTLVGGIPAKKIGERSHDLRYTNPRSHLPFL